MSISFLIKLYPYILTLDFIAAIAYVIYMYYVLTKYMSITSFEEFINKASSKREFSFKLILYFLTGVYFFQILYLIVEAELYLHNKIKTCFIDRAINQILND